MSAESGFSDIVVEEIQDQIDVQELLGDATIKDQLDGEELGAAVGREFGARVGATVGESIGREINETITAGRAAEKQPREIVADIGGAVQTGIVAALQEADIDGSALQSLLGGGVSEAVPSGEESEADSESETEADQLEADTDDETEADASTTEERDESTDTTESTLEEPAAASATEEETTVDVADAAPDTDELEATPENLEALQTETLEEFLEVLSYRDLQSVAKEVGVKANLSREEMTSRIVREVTDDEETTTDTDQ